MAENDETLDTSAEETAPESPKALAAFERYYAMGPARSLRKLADETGTKLAQLGEWSSKYGWQDQVLERMREEQAAAREAARKEAAALARRRLRNAQLLQEVGVTILAKADINTLSAEEARILLANAKTMIEAGMKAERLELGESTESFEIAPKKPIGEMNDEELATYIAMLEAQK
jgi:hypothetical protein